MTWGKATNVVFHFLISSSGVLAFVGDDRRYWSSAFAFRDLESITSPQVGRRLQSTVVERALTRVVQASKVEGWRTGGRRNGDNVTRNVEITMG